MPVGELVTEYLFRTVSERTRSQLTADEMEREFEEIAGLLPVGLPPLTDAATRREGIYTREDDWNR